MNGCETISLMLLEVFRLNESELNESLLGSFPEIKGEFEGYVSWQDGMGTGAFLTYGGVFRPHVERVLTTWDSVFHERTADFIEGLDLTGDDYAMSVVYVGVLEGLRADCGNERPTHSSSQSPASSSRSSYISRPACRRERIAAGGSRAVRN